MVRPWRAGMLPQNPTVRDLNLFQASISAHLHLPNIGSLVRGIMHRAAWGSESTGQRGDERKTKKKTKRLFSSAWVLTCCQSSDQNLGRSKFCCSVTGDVWSRCCFGCAVPRFEPSARRWIRSPIILHYDHLLRRPAAGWWEYAGVWLLPSECGVQGKEPTRSA